VSKKLISYIIQGASGLTVLFGLYKAFEHASIFWTLTLGVAGWFVGQFIRGKAFQSA
jgi:hypothetical protein